MLKMIVENDLNDILSIVHKETDYLGWKYFGFEGETFSLSVDTYKGDVYLVHENSPFGNRNYVRIKFGRYREHGDVDVFSPLLKHLREMLRGKNSSSFFYFLLNNQVKH